VEIFRDARGEIAAALGHGHQFVDLGAGDCCKGQAWLPFLAPRRYVAVDIALPELERSLARIAPDFPEIEMVGLVADFAAGLPLDEVLDATPVTFFYPGSSIGNFTPEESVAFLARVRAFCAARPGSNLLIGVDGKKATPVLDAAYDDALGVTAAFNRNVLLHLNRRFGLEFALDGFRHCGFYNPAMGRIEMHLESLRDQWIWLGEHERHFPRGARIHTENSYKYLPAEFESVLRAAGFIDTRRWASADGGYFVFTGTETAKHEAGPLAVLDLVDLVLRPDNAEGRVDRLPRLGPDELWMVKEVLGAGDVRPPDPTFAPK
jgi:dimethylhistidine N-methyltransferase